MTSSTQYLRGCRCFPTWTSRWWRSAAIPPQFMTTTGDSGTTCHKSRDRNMDAKFVDTQPIQRLLDRVAGVDSPDGNPRLKAILRDLIESVMGLIVRHDISENELWAAVNFLQRGAGEFGLLMPGVGLEHFLDLYMDAKDAAAGKTGGTPRTIEGPLYVSGAPLVDNDANLTSDPD